ncbi:hypothetical protein THL1_5404 [Pseudomonas sp. TCU-HL1]|nr:hypothetical protein THL1_5404 [Pseudomonas sp. TCU-HL1]
MMNFQPCKAAGTPKTCPNLALRALLTLAPAGAELVLLITVEVLIWIA